MQPLTTGSAVRFCLALCNIHKHYQHNQNEVTIALYSMVSVLVKCTLVVWVHQFYYLYFLVSPWNRYGIPTSSICFYYIIHWCVFVWLSSYAGYRNIIYNIRKPPESGDLCGNIWFCGDEGLPEPAGLKWSATNPNSIILPYSIPDEGCFVFISDCLMVLCYFNVRYMR